MNIGIFFGGRSREREVSFAGGRTVFDNLDKRLYTPVPFFVDSLGAFIVLDWQYLYKGTIRDFYPTSEHQGQGGFQVYIESVARAGDELHEEQIGRIGRRVQPEEFAELFDVAFLALHGPYGEDGTIQGLLEWHGIPYTGSGIIPSALGANKAAQAPLLRAAGFQRPRQAVFSREQWHKHEVNYWQGLLAEQVGFPLVVKAPNQGSSIGVRIVSEPAALAEAVRSCFFQIELTADQWQHMTTVDRRTFLLSTTDPRTGLGFPLYLGDHTVHHPAQLAQLLDDHFMQGHDKATLEAHDSEQELVVEQFIAGREFSCIVVRDHEGTPKALPPTEIVKKQDLFDYRAKYLPGISRKKTPIDLQPDQVAKITEACERLFTVLHAQVYARIDGFYTEAGEVFLNDPNTTSGMLPSSFFFHQAAEIGLSPSQFLSYIVGTSLAERRTEGKNTRHLAQLYQSHQQQLAALHRTDDTRMPVAVIMGGYSTERHISVESGRNIFEKLNSSAKYMPIPYFLMGEGPQGFELYRLPINMLLKDNADDIREKVEHPSAAQQRLLAPFVEHFQPLAAQFGAGAQLADERVGLAHLAQEVQFVFIALHGRPGEDGALQAELEKLGLPYNGSGVASSQVTINKYETNKRLRAAGFKVADHFLAEQEAWQTDPDAAIGELEQRFGFPLIAKPADDGCSSAVKKIGSAQELAAFAEMMFRQSAEFIPEAAKTIQLQPTEEFPQKDAFLVEELIANKGYRRFLEITGGMLTHAQSDGSRRYEVFQPSEALATGGVLSLEEKFLAGEGQNITPGVYDADPTEDARIRQLVQAELQRVAETMDVEGYARIDAFVGVSENGDVDVYIIEINSLPGMTPATVIFHQCALNGYTPFDFIDRIIAYGQSKLSPKTA